MFRLPSILSFLFIVPVGLFSKFYSGPFQNWSNNSLGGVFYVIFWCLVFYFIFPRTKSCKISLIVFAATCTLEILQLWHPLFLQMLRSTFIGKTVLGTTFTFKDFPYYLVGAALGWYWIKFLYKLEFKKQDL
jgi:hypothetical protein